MPQAPRCDYCSGAHYRYKCPHERTHRQQKEANDLARVQLNEQRRKDREEERRNRRMEDLARKAHDVQLERARREEEGRQERQAEGERWKTSSRRIRDLKTRAGDLRRDAEHNVEETWIGIRTLIVEAEDLPPEDVHPAERADFDAFLDKLRNRFKRAEKALGPETRRNMRTWLRLERQKSKIVNHAANVIRALDAEVMSSQEVEQVIVETRGRLGELRAVCPPPLPEPVAALYASAEQPFKDTVLAGIDDDGQRRELAEGAWRYLGGRTPPHLPSARSPSPGAVGKIVIWTVGIGTIFVVIPFVTNLGATVSDALLAFSPIGACGVVGIIVAAVLGGRARQKEYEDRQAYQRNEAEYVRQVVLLGSWRERVHGQVTEAERDLELLPQMATHLAAFEAFQTDPKRGGKIEEFDEEHHDLTDRMSELATAMEVARERGLEDDEDGDDLGLGDDDLDDILDETH